MRRSGSGQNSETHLGLKERLGSLDAYVIIVKQDTPRLVLVNFLLVRLLGLGLWPLNHRDAPFRFRCLPALLLHDYGTQRGTAGGHEEGAAAAGTHSRGRRHLDGADSQAARWCGEEGKQRDDTPRRGRHVEAV